MPLSASKPEPVSAARKLPTKFLSREHERRYKEQQAEIKRAERLKQARDKVARQQAQLWLALENRSVTRLQAAFRGRKGRARAAEQDAARPWVRERVREEERARIARERARRLAEEEAKRAQLAKEEAERLRRLEIQRQEAAAKARKEAWQRSMDELAKARDEQMKGELARREVEAAHSAVRQDAGQHAAGQQAQPPVAGLQHHLHSAPTSQVEISQAFPARPSDEGKANGQSERGDGTARRKAELVLANFMSVKQAAAEKTELVEVTSCNEKAQEESTPTPIRMSPSAALVGTPRRTRVRASLVVESFGYSRQVVVSLELNILKPAARLAMSTRADGNVVAEVRACFVGDGEVAGQGGPSESEKARQDEEVRRACRSSC